MAKHEGLRAAYEARREVCEELQKRAKKNCKFRRLNKLLDLGAKV